MQFDFRFYLLPISTISKLHMKSFSQYLNWFEDIHAIISNVSKKKLVVKKFDFSIQICLTYKTLLPGYKLTNSVGTFLNPTKEVRKIVLKKPNLQFQFDVIILERAYLLFPKKTNLWHHTNFYVKLKMLFFWMKKPVMVGN